MGLTEKLKKLKNRVAGLDSVVVAYSGGVDSTFMLAFAHKVLGDSVLAVTARSETYPVSELKAAKSIVRKLKIKHKIVKTAEFSNPLFKNNPPDRCYYCKKELFLKLNKIAHRYRMNFVIDGSNVDDRLDYRPGARAKEELGVLSPLQEAGLTKSDIREASRQLGLATWRKPALACLASRISYNSPITKKRLRRIEGAEEFLKKRFHIKGNLRVRDFEKDARVEVDKAEMNRLLDFTKFSSLLKPFGYRNAVVDLKGYRCGSLNEER
jgi:uncharacterized protein